MGAGSQPVSQPAFRTASTAAAAGDAGTHLPRPSLQLEPEMLAGPQQAYSAFPCTQHRAREADAVVDRQKVVIGVAGRNLRFSESSEAPHEGAEIAVNMPLSNIPQQVCPCVVDLRCRSDSCLFVPADHELHTTAPFIHPW